MVKCPMSALAVQNLRHLAETYEILTNTALHLAAKDDTSAATRKLAFLRAERTGRVIDSLLELWENQSCPAVCHSCRWEQCERELAIINTLTPCNQFYSPIFPQNFSESENPPSKTPESENPESPDFPSNSATTAD